MLAHDDRIDSWTGLLDRLYQDSWQPDIRRHRSPYVFRGLSEAGYPLHTALQRLGGDYPGLERHLLRNFRKYARSDTVERDTFWDWISLAQHHGLPTRLLDWTLSPLVAAHFATADPRSYDRDGVIWMVDSRQTHRELPDRLRGPLADEGADFFTVEILSQAVPDLAALDALAPPPFLLFFEPPSIDARIVNQFALFSVMPGPRASLDGWLEAHPGLWRRLIIPAWLKWEIRDKLDQANITERVLFPGLDGLSQWQKRYYTPRADEDAP